MFMITNYKLYLERSFSKQAIYKQDNTREYTDKFPKLYKPNFKFDAPLIGKIYLEKYNKDIFVEWNNRLDHKILDKVKDRSYAQSISEFNILVESNLIKLFNNNFNELTTKMNISDYNRISLFIKDIHAYLIIEYNPEQLFEEPAIIEVMTIMPILFSTININRLF